MVKIHDMTCVISVQYLEWGKICERYRIRCDMFEWQCLCGLREMDDIATPQLETHEFGKWLCKGSFFDDTKWDFVEWKHISRHKELVLHNWTLSSDAKPLLGVWKINMGYHIYNRWRACDVMLCRVNWKWNDRCSMMYIANMCMVCNNIYKLCDGGDWVGDGRVLEDGLHLNLLNFATFGIYGW